MNPSKYPYAEKFLAEHPGMSLDQAISYVDAAIKKFEEGRGQECKDRTL